MGEESIVREIRGIYDDYIAEVKNLLATRKPTDGLMGFGKRAGDDVCHERFADRIEQKLNDFAQALPSSESVYAVMRVVFEIPQKHKDDSLTYWMLLAVQGLTDVLIPLLTKQDAVKLSELFSELYPKYSWLPVQKKIAAQLFLQAGLKEHRGKGFFSLFNKRDGDKG
ncbi:MAG: hypothetical protein CVU91_08315 [Firmicutes bacterium HGW-Firmicutes-16]|nr:MAG: hypothetical protein CVU91_08315 [Firmicutes bacterium HGW-Firmicutes-16]